LAFALDAADGDGAGLAVGHGKWRNMTSDERARLNTEFALDLAMQGFDLGTVLKAFAQVREFRALGAKSHPMCRALTKALIGETTTWQQWASRSCSRPTGRRRDHDRQERHAAGLGNRAERP